MEARRRRQKGFTLIEVVVAMLITAVMVSSVFSVSLQSRRNNIKADRKVIAAQGSRQLSEALQAYVTADHSVATNIAGVTNFSAPGNSWQFPGDAASYALSTGSHTLTGFLPGWFEASPYNARAIYYVSFTSVNGSSNTWVNVSVTWAEP